MLCVCGRTSFAFLEWPKTSVRPGQSERCPLVLKARGQISKPRHPVAAQQASIDRSADQDWIQKRQRKRHADRARAPAFASGERLEIGDMAIDDFGQPAPAASDAANETLVFIAFHWACRIGLLGRQKDVATAFLRGFGPWDNHRHRFDFSLG